VQYCTFYKALALIPLVLLLAVGMTSIGVAIAANMKSMEGFPMVMNFLLLPLFFLSGAMFPLQGLPGWMTFLTRINPLSYGVDMLRGVTLSGVNITGTSTSVLSKIPAQVLSQMSPQLKSALSTATSTQMKLQTQRYPLWLDLVVVAGFTVLMLVIAIWQFSRQT
jgi:ABC-type transport system involved in multi-copper enzyme maturation permease subunit